MNDIKSLYGNSIGMIAIFVLLLMCNYVCPSPMMYKRNPGDIYERDLVPVSSTVIPLTVLEVSYGQGGKPSEEYKEAYLKKLRKKVREHNSNSKNESDNQENPDTLITIKKKQSDAANAKIKVKAATTTGIITTKMATDAGAAAVDNVN